MGCYDLGMYCGIIMNKYLQKINSYIIIIILKDFSL